MPSLVLFDRRWNIGSDDFLLLPFLFAGVRVFWIATLSGEFGVIVGKFGDVEDCDHYQVLEVYMVGVTLINLCFVIEEILLGILSRRGGVMTPSRRRLVPHVLAARLTLWFVELLWNIFGTYIMTTEQSCLSNSGAGQVIIDGLIISSWVLSAVYACVGYLAWDPAGKRALQSLDHRQEPEYVSQWQKRIKRGFMCTCASVDAEAYLEVAQVFSNMFRNLDLVPSDVAVGMVLLRKEQKKRQRREKSSFDDNGARTAPVSFKDGSRGYISGSRLHGSPLVESMLSLPDSDRELIFTLKRFMAISLGAYGWPMYSMLHPVGCCCLLSKTRCSTKMRALSRESNTMVTKGSSCLCSESALLASMEEEDPSIEIVEVNNTNENHCTPYAIVLDHTRKGVVVVFRGTLSLHDVLTDIRAIPTPLDPDSSDSSDLTRSAHKGIFCGAQACLSDIESRGTMECLLSTHPEYNLILTGHSLGAGVASLLSVILHPRYPTLQCYAFSPPGGLASYEVGEEAKAYVTSVVFGKDIIPRLSECTLQTLREGIMRNLTTHGKVAKHRVIGTCCCCTGSTSDSSTLESKRALEEHRSRVLNDNAEMHTNLLPMGKVLHIMKNEGKGYQPCWRSADELNEILVSPQMVNDHFPHHNYRILCACAKQIDTDELLEIPTSYRERFDSPVYTAPDSLTTYRRDSATSVLIGMDPSSTLFPSLSTGFPSATALVPTASSPLSTMGLHNQQTESRFECDQTFSL